MTALPVYAVNFMDTVGAYDWYTYDTEHDACVAARRVARDASIAYVEVLAVTADLAAVCLYDIIASDAVSLVAVIATDAYDAPLAIDVHNEMFDTAYESTL